MEAITKLKAGLKAIAKRIVYSVAPPPGKFHAKSKESTIWLPSEAVCVAGSCA